MAKAKEPQLADTSQDVKLSLTGANSFHLPGPYEIGEKIRLSVSATVKASYPELVTDEDGGPITRDVVHLAVTRLVQAK